MHPGPYLSSPDTTEQHIWISARDLAFLSLTKRGTVRWVPFAGVTWPGPLMLTWMCFQMRTG